MSEKYTVARLTKDKEHFEILVKPQKASDYRTGKIARITEVLVAETIFADANKGTKVSEEQMRKAFETTDPLKIADAILKDEYRGDMSLEETIKLAVKCLVKALEARQLPPRIKIAIIPAATKKLEMLTDETVEGYIKELGSSK